MQVVITAVGPDNRGLADPIVHSVTEMGANIAEIQMYDHDEERVFSMLTRVDIEANRYDELRQAMVEVSRGTKLSIRTWSPDFTTPGIAELTISEAENLVYVRKEGGIGFDGIQSLEDLRNNWNRLIDVAGLTPEERREAVQLFNSKVEKVPGTEV